MKHAYNNTWLANLHIVKEGKRWLKHSWISKEQFEQISIQYPSSFYHPNIFIRLLLFVATLIALFGVTGLFALAFIETGRQTVSVLCIFYGSASWLVMEKTFIGNNHYKSGVNEALLYNACGFIIGGFSGLTEGNIHITLTVSILILTFAAIRFIDLISTAAALACFGYYIFYLLYEAGGVVRLIMPFVFMAIFAGMYFAARKWRQKEQTEAWENSLLIAEAISLLAVCATGNYLVVRELSISMMDLQLQEGQDIPFAWLFYFFTVAIPAGYLYFGIRLKDVVLIRVSLVTIAFAVFTFKYYFSLGHHEITLTVAGMILIVIAVWLFRYLKTPRNGYTAENILSEKWGSENVSAFVISQTMGGNKAPEHVESEGSFGGGGSTDSF